MVACVDAQRETYGVESICAQLPIAPSTYWRHKAQQADPTCRSARTQRDEALKVEITRVWDEQEQVYGAEKVWRQLRREEIAAARYRRATHEGARARGVVRGGRAMVTTRPDPAAHVPDLVDRQFRATRPNQLWVSASLTCRRPTGLSTPRSSSMSSRGALSAGRWRTRCAPTWSWTHSSRRFISDARRARSTWSTTAIAGAIPVHALHGAPGGRPHRPVRRQSR